MANTAPGGGHPPAQHCSERSALRARRTAVPRVDRGWLRRHGALPLPTSRPVGLESAAIRRAAYAASSTFRWCLTLTALGIRLFSAASPDTIYRALVCLATCLGPVTLFYFALSFTGSRRWAFATAVAYSLVSPSYALFPAVEKDRGIVQLPWRIQVLAKYGEGPHDTGLTLLPLALAALWRAAVKARRTGTLSWPPSCWPSSRSPTGWPRSRWLCPVCFCYWPPRGSPASVWAGRSPPPRSPGCWPPFGSPQPSSAPSSQLARRLLRLSASPDAGCSPRRARRRLRAHLAGVPLAPRFRLSLLRPDGLVRLRHRSPPPGTSTASTSSPSRAATPSSSSSSWRWRWPRFCDCLAQSQRHGAPVCRRAGGRDAAGRRPPTLGRSHAGLDPLVAIPAREHRRVSSRPMDCATPARRAASSPPAACASASTPGSTSRRSAAVSRPASRTASRWLLAYRVRANADLPPGHEYEDTFSSSRPSARNTSWSTDPNPASITATSSVPTASSPRSPPSTTSRTTPSTPCLRAPWPTSSNPRNFPRCQSLSPYVAAIEDPSRPPLALQWTSAGAFTVSGPVRPGERISVQINDDPGWRATQDGAPVPISQDGLGFMVLKATPSAAARIEVRYRGTVQPKILGVVSALAWIAALFGLSRKPYGKDIRI